MIKECCLLKLNHILDRIASVSNCAGIVNITRGIEREGLRVSSEGLVSDRPHPAALGSPLTHPQITTDASESLLEFVTQPSTCLSQLLLSLEELHHFTYQHLKGEMLWASSMPCYLDRILPAARYGSSNSGMMKSIYRVGLAHRYGNALAIAGLHYNFSISNEFWVFLRNQSRSELSLKDFKTQGYLNLSRNFLRYFWLLLYLFGASPSVCKNLILNQRHDLHTLKYDNDTLYSPYATSLRMSNLGFKCKAQDNLMVTYNCLGSYINTLCGAMSQPYDEYVNKGIKHADGSYQQLNDRLLQIENEFYSVIRPKRTSHKSENGLTALANRGVEYIEVRCMDVNPYEPTGVSRQQIKFLDTFLIYCLLEDSPTLSAEEYANIICNQQRVASNGRRLSLMLLNHSVELPMIQWAEDIFSKLYRVADVMDFTSNDGVHRRCIELERCKSYDSDLTPSAMMLSDMRESRQGFVDFIGSLSKQYKIYFDDKPFHKQQKYKAIAKKSITQQLKEESESDVSFEEYMQQYYEQYKRLCAVA